MQPKIPSLGFWNLLQIMSVPIAFQAKAMTTKLILSTAVLLLSIAILFASFDEASNIQEFKNQTSLSPSKNHDYLVIPLPNGAVGPESFAFDRVAGGPFTGVSDGRIIRWRANESRWVDFAVTSPERNGCVGGGEHSEREHFCGRPLGLCMNDKTGDLYIADAYMGLVMVGPQGGLASPLVKEVEGLALGFTNSLDIDQNSGLIYFTDSSTRFQRRNHVNVIMSGDDSGRVMKFDPRTRKASVLLGNLRFPNGVAVSEDGEFLLFVETTTCRLYKYWLKTGVLEVVAELPGFPDNVRRSRNGEFWVGIHSRRGKLMEWIISRPWIGNALLRVLPLDATKLHSGLVNLVGRKGMGVRLDRDGTVAEVLDGRRWERVSEVQEANGFLWIGSVVNSFFVRDKIPISSPFISHFNTN